MTELVLDGAVHARACVNIALIKYWGKAPSDGRAETRNLPAVPSLSLTLGALYTETTVRFDTDADADRFRLDGAVQGAEPLRRVSQVLDHVRSLGDVQARFVVDSVNHVPTAAGLASSASGMAALAAAASRCAGLGLTDDALSAVARVGSGSASRSIHGGWVVWDGPQALALAPAEHWDLRVVIAVIGAGPKAIGSRDAMNLTARTSPFYAGWVAQARETFRQGVDAVQRRDFDALVDAMERSTYRMHACAMGADPPINYLHPSSLAVIREVERIRADGVPCGFTMDAGPNVKVFAPTSHAADIEQRLTQVPGVLHTIVTDPGDGVSVRVQDTPEDRW